MVDRDRYASIMHYDMDQFAQNVENMTYEQYKKIYEYNNYVTPQSSHIENLTVRNNMKLAAIGNHKEDDDFTLVAGLLVITFGDTKWYNTISDMSDGQIADSFHTTKDNVVMFRMLNEKMKSIREENKVYHI